MDAFRSIETTSFLMTGRRWDISIKEPIQFTPSWEQEIRERVAKDGKLHGPSGMDYFVFPRNLQLNMPDFITGRPGHDGWLIYKARSSGIPVIDATKVTMALHQSHDYSHHKDGTKGVWEGAEAKRNIKLAGGLTRIFTLRDADWILTSDDGLRRPGFTRRIFSELSLFYPWRLILALKRKLQSGL